MAACTSHVCFNWWNLLILNRIVYRKRIALESNYAGDTKPLDTSIQFAESWWRLKYTNSFVDKMKIHEVRFRSECACDFHTQPHCSSREKLTEISKEKVPSDSGKTLLDWMNTYGNQPISEHEVG